MRRFRFLGVIGLGALLAFLMAPAALAGSPDMVKFEINTTRTISAAENGCGFDTVRHVEGTFYVTVYYDSDGNVAREVWRVSSFFVTDSNPLSGKSITSTLAGPFIMTPNPDGTITVTIPGNDGHFTAPGEGVLWSNVGLIIYTADSSDPYTPLSVIAVRGLYTDFNGPYPEACSALS